MSQNKKGANVLEKQNLQFLKSEMTPHPSWSFLEVSLPKKAPVNNITFSTGTEFTIMGF